MERRFVARLEELLDDAAVKPAILRDMLPRLERFLEPFGALLATTEQRTHRPKKVLRYVQTIFVLVSAPRS